MCRMDVTSGPQKIAHLDEIEQNVRMEKKSVQNVYKMGEKAEVLPVRCGTAAAMATMLPTLFQSDSQ